MGRKGGGGLRYYGLLSLSLPLWHTFDESFSSVLKVSNHVTSAREVPTRFATACPSVAATGCEIAAELRTVVDSLIPPSFPET